VHAVRARAADFVEHHHADFDHPCDRQRHQPEEPERHHPYRFNDRFHFLIPTFSLVGDMTSILTRSLTVAPRRDG